MENSIDLSHPSSATAAAPYTLLLSEDTRQRLLAYVQALQADQKPGARLAKVLREHGKPHDLVSMLERLFQTKEPQIFAESAVYGDGTDWTQHELGLLGDISVAVPVRVHDDGTHHAPRVHPVPIDATMLFTPGALLANGKGYPAADSGEVVRERTLHLPGFLALYERRLLPVLLHANETAARKGRRAVVTVPGLGCGQFAGVFRGELEQPLALALQTLLERHADRLQHVALVRFDPYRSGTDQQVVCGQTLLRVRPLLLHLDTPQLCPPTAYEEAGDDFSDCDLFSVVAWDHVSWPGNDYYIGCRETDDGVKAAATSTMHAMTGIEGRYDPKQYKYLPPSGYRLWEQVIKSKRLRLGVTADQVRVLS
ncbi:hypothetical protein [Sphaerotilus sp.]|uniref:hypothetical protein n=1 Tax=Sphaerotilus sp. TaxID=2093942 RepID=UPI002ACD5862|nr:hypothetical protein [Sphaerotilus sp.]MDZ7855085.1 hypothetical protein [Sphaerotilus sp.]